MDVTVVPAESTAIADPTFTTAERSMLVCSFDTTTDEGRAKAYNATIAADRKVEDNIGEGIAMKDFLIEQIVVLNEETGELEPRLHSVIFAADGKSYESQSKGIASSLRSLDGLYHFDQREQPLDIEFGERKARLGKMFYIKVVA